MDFARGRVDTLASVFACQMSRRNRRLIETAAMRFPSVVVERCDILPCLDWRPSFQRRMGPMGVIEVLVYRLRVLGQWFDGIRFYAAASSPRRSRRTWAGLR